MARNLDAATVYISPLGRHAEPSGETVQFLGPEGPLGTPSFVLSVRLPVRLPVLLPVRKTNLNHL